MSVLQNSRSAAGTSARQISPREFAASIDSHARISISDSLFPGESFAGLSKFLNRQLESPVKQERPDSLRRTNKLCCPAILYELQAKAPPSAIWLDSPAALDRADDVEGSPLGGRQRVLFLRGYQSAEWVAHVGAKYRIDPGFWIRHASFLENKPADVLWSDFVLPSAANSIVQIPITSVGAHKLADGVMSHDQIEHARQEAKVAMVEYLHKLRTGRGWSPGASVVRSFSILDEDHFMIEQLATLCVVKSAEQPGSWIAIVWLDIGADLAKSPYGPWSGDITNGFKLDLHRYFLPVNQSRSNIALSPQPHINHAVENNDAVEIYGFPQSCLLIPQFYGCALDPAKACADPFYALSELLQFTAASELTLLKKLATKIEKSVTRVLEVDYDNMLASQADLLFYRRCLEKRLQEYSSFLTLLTDHPALEWWPLHDNSAVLQASSPSALRTQSDFKHLSELARRLQDCCDREMTVMMNTTNLLEVKRGIEQGETLFKFTLVASVFVPLSFTTSLFGMNVVEFGQGSQPIWIWALVTVVMFIASFLVLFWNKHRMRTTWDSVRRLFIW
ncbi:hypothetical protein MMC17_008108 [Xylographa soralifera]|nr:hypothetical protein [Xylographa soralifera]